MRRLWTSNLAMSTITRKFNSSSTICPRLRRIFDFHQGNIICNMSISNLGAIWICPTHISISTMPKSLRFVSVELLSLYVVFSCLYSFSVPETGSTVLRQVVESLLITHTDTALNSSGRLVVGTLESVVGDSGDPPQPPPPFFNVDRDIVWCANLLRRPSPSLVTAAPVAAMVKPMQQ